MRWVGIAGSWRETGPQVERDVRQEVEKIIKRGDGVITGGALNVDAFALHEAMKHDKTGMHIKVVLPAALNVYARHYRKRAREGVITSEQAEGLVDLLSRLKKLNPEALVENMANTEVNHETYFERITQIVNRSDELVAFQVNQSPGTQDTIDKARAKGIPVKVLAYQIAQGDD